MTEEQYKRSIETGYLELSLWGKFAHFAIILFLACMPIMVLLYHFFTYLNVGTTYFDSQEISVIIIPILFGAFFYWLLKNNLKLQSVETTLNKSELLKLIGQVSKELRWMPYFEEGDIFVAKTNPGFFSGSFGESITILFNTHKVLINSIPDPGRRAGLDITGRNKRNVTVLINAIQKAQESRPQK